ncbi:MAG: endolytic transglycosylase MltG [Gemmatimonadales bacterium]
MTRLAMVLLLAACAAPPGPAERVTIPQGAGLRTIADTLDARGLVTSARWFRTYVALRGMDRSLKAGVYDVPRGLSVPALAERLATGQPATQPFTLFEGWMLAEVVEGAERNLGIPTADFEAATRSYELRQRVGTPHETLEGYLYPTTYQVRIGATALEVVTQMVEEFERHWLPHWTERAATIGMTRDQVVVLASIIEGEVRHDRDRPYVASVYHNRLRESWRLQADPTVIYALGRRRRLFERDYQTRSPYNTYLIDGLPPGPIGQPSAPSLQAALYPARTDFMFFVARNDGWHVFTRTLREHLAAIREVRGR